MIKKLLILLTFTMSISSAYAQQYTVVFLPDGTTMVCWRIGTAVNCQKQ